MVVADEGELGLAGKSRQERDRGRIVSGCAVDDLAGIACARRDVTVAEQFGIGFDGETVDGIGRGIDTE